MRIKQIVTIVVVVAVVAVAGFFAYRFLTDSAAVSKVKITGPKAILPHGAKLDFDKINEYNQTGRQFQYPKVTPADAGLTLDQIITQ